MSLYVYVSSENRAAMRDAAKGMADAQAALDVVVATLRDHERRLAAASEYRPVNHMRLAAIALGEARPEDFAPSAPPDVLDVAGLRDAIKGLEVRKAQAQTRLDEAKGRLREAIAGAIREAANGAATAVYLAGATMVREGWRLLAGAQTFETQCLKTGGETLFPIAGQGKGIGYCTIPGGDLPALAARSTIGYFVPLVFDSRLEGDSPDKALREFMADVRSEIGTWPWP